MQSRLGAVGAIVIVDVGLLDAVAWSGSVVGTDPGG